MTMELAGKEDLTTEEDGCDKKRINSLDKFFASKLKLPKSKKLSTSLTDLSLSNDYNNHENRNNNNNNNNMKNKDSSVSSSSDCGKNQSSNAGALKHAAHQLKKFLSPSVKSRDVEFKKLFDVPETECYITSYSCAFQKDILIHGKLYLSQNFVGFYSNIFGWETKILFSYKEIATLKKKKTAKIIPNAMQVATKAEVWAWSHYGTDDAIEDIYNDSSDINCNGINDDETFCKTVPIVYVHRASIPDLLDRRSSGSYGSELNLSSSSPRKKGGKKQWRRNKKNRCSLNKKKSVSLLDIPNADSVSITSTGSDSSDDLDKEVNCGCSKHDGCEIMNAVYPVSVDQMFLLLFTDCQFYKALQEDRQTTDLVLNDWKVDNTSGTKSRQVSYTVKVSNPKLAGSKTAAVIESQVCEACSNSGRKCIVKCVCQSSGVTYAETFCTFTRYCITRVNANQCRVKVYGGITYNKSCWGIIKSMIEKHAMAGMTDYFQDLDSHLKQECKKYGLPLEDINSNFIERNLNDMQPSHETKDANVIFTNNMEYVLKFVILILLIMFVTNVVLYCKLIGLEKSMEALKLINNHQRFSAPSLSEMEHEFEKEFARFKQQRLKWTSAIDDTVKIVQEIENSLKEFRSHLSLIRNDLGTANDKDA